MPLPGVSRLDRIGGSALTNRFRQIGLTRDAIRRMTGSKDDLRSPLEPTREALLRDDAQAVALRLFFCRRPVAPEAVRECLGAELAAAALEAGVLVESSACELEAPFHVRTVRNLYLFSDYLGPDRDAVMGAGETTAVLYRAGRPRRRIGRALDLGCGAGTLALLLASDAAEVVGTDINPRAIAIARFNACVNGVGNVEFRTGDVDAPVRGERFDLILSQPPYYPKPAGVNAAADQVFLHGGERGDEISLRVLAAIPELLTSDGRAIVFTSWPEARRAASREGLRVLELYTDRRELHGTRQSLNVIEHAGARPAWSAGFEVSADCWGYTDSASIDRLIAIEELLHAPEERLISLRLRFPPGAAPWREGSQMFLRCPPEALIGMRPVDEHTWTVIEAVNRAPDVRTAVAGFASPGAALAATARALRSGLLVLAE